MKSNIARRLLQDRYFLFALLLGPLFWWANHYFTLSVPPEKLSAGLLLILALLYPVLEELSFRGALQGALLLSKRGRARVLGLSSANWLCSLVFALFHLYGHNLLWAAAVFFPSLLFGFIRDRHNSVLPCIILHCFYNAGFYVFR